MKEKRTKLRYVPQGLLLCFIFSVAFSCNQRNKKNIHDVKSPEIKNAIIKKPPSSFSDTLFIHSPSVVFYNPDSLQLQKMKEIIEKNEYETEVHNCFYQMRNARMVLKKYWPKIHIVETSTKRYLLFVKADKTISAIDLNSKGDMCGLFLFDGKKEPELADMMNIETALGFYFAKSNWK
jgi:hypothetical protein